MKSLRIVLLSACLAAASGASAAAYDDLINAANIGDAAKVANFIDRGHYIHLLFLPTHDSF